MRFFCLVALAFASTATAFPAYASLAGLSEEELERIIPTLQVRAAQAPPGPLNDTSAKLVNDQFHPWKATGPYDIRGPCPGLNTLASHGVRITTDSVYLTFTGSDISLPSGFLAMELQRLRKL